MSTTNQIRRSYQNDQSVCIIACHGIVTQIPFQTIDQSEADFGIGKSRPLTFRCWKENDGRFDEYAFCINKFSSVFKFNKLNLHQQKAIGLYVKEYSCNLSDQLKLSPPSPWRLFKTSNIIKQNFGFEYTPEYTPPRQHSLWTENYSYLPYILSYLNSCTI